MASSSVASSSLFLLFLSLSIFWCASSSKTLLKAAAVLRSDQGVRGTICFTQEAYPGPTAVTGKISGLKSGFHGFHVHVYGNLTDGCTSAGPHYNPFNKDHGAPQDQNRHAGDLGNVKANANGVVHVTVVDYQIPLTGPYSIVGRAIVVHADRDDLGRGGTSLSKTTGNSGARVACGVIILQK